MKYLIAIAIIIFLVSSASANDRRKALLEENDRIQDKLHDCLLALADAKRHDDVWQSHKLTIAECTAVGYEAMDMGQRLLRESLRDD